MARQWTTTELSTLKQMAKDGYCAAKIAETIDRSVHAVHARAWSHGIRLAYPTGEDFKRTTVPDCYIKAIRLLREAGLTAMEISSIFKRQHRVSTGYVKRICAGEDRSDAIRR